jgi:hypothetical protein
MSTSNSPPEGLHALKQACKDVGVSLMPVVAAARRWVNPETYRGAPIYDAKYERQYTNTNRGTGAIIEKTEPNIQAGRAIRQAMGIPVSWRGFNWTICHIWGIDDP